MFATDCLVCNTLNGALKPPGGIIYENDFWLVDHTLPPILSPGQVIIKLKRHCEHLAQLSPEEGAVFGLLLQRVSQAVMLVSGAERVHAASYGEGIAHVHFLVTPRTSDLPANNIQLMKRLQRRRLLYRMGMRWLAQKESHAAAYAAEVRDTLWPNRSV